jgi:thiamine biosynthesis lipoprotein
MGMPVAVTVRDGRAAPEAVERAFAWLRWVDATFSTHRPGSEIERLNRGELPREARAPAGPRGPRALRGAARLTGGFFDARAPRPGGVDPTGLVKGWAVDRAADLLEEAGARDFCIDGRRDLRLRAARGAWASATRAAAPARPPCWTSATPPSPPPGPTSAAPTSVEPGTGRPAAGALS